MSVTEVQIIETRQEPFLARVPGSKSLTNRALILAAQATHGVRIRNALHCDDTLRLAAALDAFDGVTVKQTADGFAVDRQAEKIVAPAESLDMAGAGTPARFLLSFAATAEGETVITGGARLRERPMHDLLDALERMGVRFECLEERGHLPVRIHGSSARTQRWRVNGSVSSQFASSLLLFAAQQPAGPITIEIDGKAVSRSYIEMTAQLMRKLGIHVERVAAKTYRVTPGRPVANEILVEPDASSLSYWLAAAAITGLTVEARGIGGEATQGDIGLAFLLARMGCDLEILRDTIRLTGARLKGIEADMSNMPDVVLTLAVVAARASGPTMLTDIGNLRVKECDRIHAIVTELGRLGVKADCGDDWIRIVPSGTLQPGFVRTYGDHRVAMSFGLLKLIDERISIEHPHCVDKSFPGFWRELDSFLTYHKESKGVS